MIVFGRFIGTFYLVSFALFTTFAVKYNDDSI